MLKDYFNVVKKPIDLSLIKHKLDEGLYHDPWDFVDDMWLMFNNAWLYNRKTSRVYKFCTKVRLVECCYLIKYFAKVYEIVNMYFYIIILQKFPNLIK